MNLFSLGAFLTFIFCIYSIFVVLKISYKSPITILFSTYMLSISIWALAYVFIYPEQNKEVVWAWYKFGALGWIPAQFIRIVFYIFLTKNDFLRKQYWLFIILGIFPIIMLYQQYTGTFLIKDFVYTSMGNIEIVNNSPLLILVLFLYSLTHTLFGIGLLFVGVKSIKRKEIQRSFIILLLSHAIIDFGTVGLNVMLPMNDIRIPAIGVFVTITIPILIFYFIIKYKFFYVNLYSVEKIQNDNIIDNLYDLDTIFNSINSGIIAIDLDYSVIRTNNYIKNFTGINPKIGKTKCYEILYKKNSPCKRCPVKDTIKKQIQLKQELFDKDGKLFKFDVYIFPLLTSLRSLTGYIILYNDKTELYNQRKLQEDTEKMIHHDLKNHLYSIQSVSEHYKMKVAYDNKGTKEVFTRIYNESRKMSQIINSSLTLIKLENGEYNIIKEKVNLFYILLNIKLSLEPLLNQKNIKLEYSSIEKNRDSFIFEGESLLIENMLLNIIKNAVEASPENNTVFISAVTTEKTITIKTKNKGVIPPQLRNNFFDKYSTYKVGGTGLGNYTALLIAKVHNGNISFTTSEEKGTEITITLQNNKLLNTILK